MDRTNAMWVKRAAAVLLLFALAVPPGRAAGARPAPEDVARSIVSGTEVPRIAADLDAAVSSDGDWLNLVRLHLKAAGHADDATRLLEAVAEKGRTDAVLYNLALSYVDRLPGHNLLRKGQLSTASVRIVDEILARRPEDWLALHIRGLNNLYWPDWFDRARPAKADLAHAVAAGQPLLTDSPDEDGLAASYLALGDAEALTDQPDAARATWAEGARWYPYYPDFGARLALTGASQHEAVRAARDSDQPIDTDLTHLRAVARPGRFVPLTGGTLYGPGPLEDQELHPGGLHDLRLARPFTGAIPQMNNGAGEPHMPGEIAVGRTMTGRFSDGTPANKNIDVGHVFLMNGKFKLFLAALDGGPHHGRVRFYLDRYWNWTIEDDIGIDPGFPEGVIKFDNFMFSTSPRLLPESTQTQNKEPGGVDRAGSLVSHGFVPGLLGGDEDSGVMIGMVNAIGSFPLDSVFLPGAPFAQTRIFRTDLPIAPEVAGFLTLANAISHLRAAEASAVLEATANDAPLMRLAHERFEAASRHFARAAEWTGGLDNEGKAAYARLMAGARGLDRPDQRARFVCAADGDLALLAARLWLVRRADKDGSRLADLMRCDAR